ncbi:MAG TPA: BamA/TamA family outer membrane protein [bacterium]|nr:BamA/TamA family outer membrane protein [bacterium]
MSRQSRLAIVLLAIVSIVFFAATARSQENGTTEVMIKKIDVTGNFEVPDEEILGVVISKENENLSTENLEEDLQRIFDLGYFSEDVKASLSEYEGGAKITFRVEENPVINDIIFEGNNDVSNTEFLDMIATKKNSILNSNDLKADIEAIEKKYQDDGYIAARVIDARVDGQGNLLIVVSEGTIQDIKIAYILRDKVNTEEFEILEDGKTKPYVVTREMKTKVGDTYNVNKIGKDLQRIYNLGFFEDVHTRLDPGNPPGTIILVLEVEEAKTGTAGFGAGYSSNTGLTGFLTFTERNLKGKGRRTEVKLEFGGKQDDYELGYFEPWLDKKQTSLEMNIYSTSRENLTYGLLGVVDTDDYEELRTGFDMTFGRPISNYTRVFTGFKAETINVEPEDYDYLDGKSRSVTGAIKTDTRDYIFNPTDGRFDSASLELNGGPIIGGDYDYEKLVFDFRRYYPVRKKQVLAGRIKIGLGRGDIPQFDLFDLGGVNTLRGYDEYQFAGSKMLLYNAEYRFILSGNLSAVLFADAGNTWMDKDDMSFWVDDGLHRAVGVGIRLKIAALGIGPIRLDYAIAEGHETEIHFGFGHMF